VVADPTGARVLRARALGKPENPEDLGKRVAEQLFGQGANELLSQTAFDKK
jgi:porphobilinogen deaminase